MTPLFAFIVPAVAAYLFGSIPLGLILVKLGKGIDVRTVGSGNIGATNVRRAAGSGLAAVVLIGDSLKGLLPVLLAEHLIGNDAPLGPWAAAAAGTMAIIGHMFPLYLKFKASGKGVATALGCFLYLTPLACIFNLAVFLVLVTVTRRISIGSVAAAGLLPLSIWLTTHDIAFSLAGLTVAVLIVLRHRDNLHRLLSGKEPPL